MDAPLTSQQRIAQRVAAFREHLRETLEVATSRARVSQQKAVEATRRSGNGHGNGSVLTSTGSLPRSTYTSSMHVTVPPRAAGVAQLLPGVSKLFSVPAQKAFSMMPRSGGR